VETSRAIAPDEVWRAFVAVETSTELQQNLARWQERIRATGAQLSCPAPEHLHLTLVFLSAIFAAQREALAALLDRVAASVAPMRIAVHGLGMFGPARHPRVVWAGVDANPALLDLQLRLENEARALGIPLEQRPFHPHLTLARVKSGRRVDTLVEQVARGAQLPLGEIDARRVVLFRSHLDRPAPCYSVLHAAPLVG